MHKHELLVDIVRTALLLLLTFSPAVASLTNCSFDKVVFFFCNSRHVKQQIVYEIMFVLKN